MRSLQGLVCANVLAVRAGCGFGVGPLVNNCIVCISSLSHSLCVCVCVCVCVRVCVVEGTAFLRA